MPNPQGVVGKAVAPNPPFGTGLASARSEAEIVLTRKGLPMLPQYILRTTFLPPDVREFYDIFPVDVSVQVINRPSDKYAGVMVEVPIATLEYLECPVKLTSRQTEQAIADARVCRCGECLACKIREAYKKARGL